jgi:hypothetical protein
MNERIKRQEEELQQQMLNDKNKKGKKHPGKNAGNEIQQEKIELTLPSPNNISLKENIPPFSRWIGSIFQIIKDRNLLDVRTGENIWQKIYPQKNGVPIYNKNGHYIVKLYHMGKLRIVDIDDRMPVSHNDEFFLPRCDSLEEIWPALLTKALIKLYSYKIISNKFYEIGDSEPFYALTGYIPTLLKEIKLKNINNKIMQQDNHNQSKIIETDSKKDEESNKDNNNVLLYSTTFSQNKMNENKISELQYTKTFFPNVENFSQSNKMSINSNSSGQNISSTNDTGITLYTNSFLNNSGNKNSFDSNKNNINENKNTIYENKNTIYENNNIQEYYFEPNVDIYKVLSLEDRRTTIMIKNIPNKFNRAILLSTIDINFKGTYDLFILPTDGNRNKNFGYSFINFTSSYFIPYFYFMFNNKKWSSTNSKKICEITYSKVQGRDNLISYYANKIIYFNNVKEVNSEQKYIIPNDYKNLFVQLFPNQIIEEYPFYFTTKIPT